jgi:formylglycine-generating enzyme required for sulfatase activity
VSLFDDLSRFLESRLETEKSVQDFINRNTPGSSFKDCETCPEMVVISAGSFQMGSSVSWFSSKKPPENEQPSRNVSVKGFAMGKFEVTQKQWRELMGNDPSKFKGDELPVEQVSWEDAVGFSKKLNERLASDYPSNAKGLIDGWERLLFRLPTEAEWEYACRAGTTGDTYAGDLDLKSTDQTIAEVLDSIAWYGGNSGHKYDLEKSEKMTWLADLQDEEKKGGTRKVAQKAPNAWGLYDMLGNVSEWCQDWYKKYPAERVVDPTGQTQGTSRVIRGGSWHFPARRLRSTCRLRLDPGVRRSFLGFRLLSSARPAK